MSYKNKKQSLGEEIGNSITHGMGCLLSIVGLVLLIIKAKEPIAYLSVLLFGIGLILLYVNSCLYHSFKNDTGVKRLWKRFDHLSIYVLISATYAPILLIQLGDTFALIVFIIQWSVTVLGIISKCIWPNRFQTLHLVFFLILGWSGLIFIPNLYQNAFNLFLFVLLGGISYTIGVVFYAMLKFKYHHFVWHIAVMIGSILHFIGIYLYIL